MTAVAFRQYPAAGHAGRGQRAGVAAAHQAGSSTRSVRADQQGIAASARLGQLYVPPGWPEQVRPPASPDWELSAVTWLLDCCPADYRAHAVLRKHPVVLARFAADFVEGQIRSTRVALSQARESLTDYVSCQVLDSAADVLQTEEARLLRVRRGVALVEEALRGKVFIAKL